MAETFVSLPVGQRRGVKDLEHYAAGKQKGRQSVPAAIIGLRTEGQAPPMRIHETGWQRRVSC